MARTPPTALTCATATRTWCASWPWKACAHRVVVIGEDLGTVEPFVRETLARFGILSYRLFYFEKNSRGEFRRYDEYPLQALVSSTTHDPAHPGRFLDRRGYRGAPPSAGTFAGDDQYRAALRGPRRRKAEDAGPALRRQPAARAGSRAPPPRCPTSPANCTNAVIGFLALTPSQLMVVNQEDLTKEVAQQNLPATTWQYPNWSRKMRFSVGQLRTDRTARDFTAMFRNLAAAYRAHEPHRLAGIAHRPPGPPALLLYPANAEGK